MPKPPPIDHLSFDDEPTEVERQPRGARMERMERELAMIEHGSAGLQNREKGPHNEDRMLVEPSAGLYGVLDGMGGHAGGEVASRLADEEIRKAALKMPEEARYDGAATAAFLQRAIESANARIIREAGTSAELKGMGTTCSMLQIVRDRVSGKPTEVVTAQVGDSRIYRLRGGKLERITKDQSPIQEMIDAGFPMDGQPLPPDADQVGDPDADSRMTQGQRTFVKQFRNRISGAVGLKEAVRIDIQRHAVEEGDVYFATSDGVHDNLTDREIEELAHRHAANPQLAVEEMTRIARQRDLEKTRATDAKQTVEGVLERGKDDDTSAVAVRLNEVHAAAEIVEELRPLIAKETIDTWRQMNDDGLEGTTGQYQRILRAREQGKPVNQQEISRANGMRERYLTATTDEGRATVLAEDSAYKRAALEAIDGVYIERTVPAETLAEWEKLPTADLETTTKEYRKVLDAHDQGFELPVQAVSRANGIRDAYKRARTDAERRDVLRRDRLYKEMATRALDRILATRAGGTFAHDYDFLDVPAKARQWLTAYEHRLNLLGDQYKPLEQKRGAVTRFIWPDGASSERIQACLAAEREHVRRRIRQAKRSLLAGGQRPGRAAGTNQSQPMA
jgi:protein phosphatase